jgi:hypothetical protein
MHLMLGAIAVAMIFAFPQFTAALIFEKIREDHFATQAAEWCYHKEYCGTYKMFMCKPGERPEPETVSPNLDPLPKKLDGRAHLYY